MNRRQRRIRARWVVVAAVMAVASGLWTLAAAREVTSVASALVTIARNFRSPPVFTRSPRITEERRASTGEEGGRGSEEPGSRRVSFSLTHEDLDRLLRRRTLVLGERLSWERRVSSALASGQIILAATNGLRFAGITVVRYSGRSVWTLTALEGGLGVRLSQLRVAGVPVPFASWLLTRLSGNAREDWVHLQMPPGQVIDEVEIGEGKLVVRGRVR